MVIGNGDIASVIPDHLDRIYFASGVSNSAERRFKEFWREGRLLLDQPRNKHLVYFSSLCIFYSKTPYAQHKRRMEALVKSFPHYTIIRLGNITWGKNPKTLINYLKAHPEAEIQDTERYLVDKEEFLHWMKMIPKWNCEMNITGRRLTIKEIVDDIRCGQL